MRCLVTGASGHLGSFLVARLVAEGWTVTALVRQSSDLWRLAGVIERVEVVRAELADIADAGRAIVASKPDAVFHLAWEGVTSQFRNDENQQAVNVTGSIKLFEIVRDAGCKLWVGLGSQAEYGPQDEILTEHTHLNPTTAYGAAKLTVGLKTKELAEQTGVRHVWLRLLATYGPKDDERHLIPSVIRQLLKRERPALTAGEQKWDYLYVEDAAEALFRAAATDTVSGVFNLGSGESHRLRDILERIRDLIDPSLPLGFGELPYAVDHPMHLQTSIERFCNATGWKPTVALDEGLRRTIQWYRAQAKIAQKISPEG